jgi:FkbM family methyltransferase
MRFIYSTFIAKPIAESSYEIILPFITPKDVVVEVGAGHGGGTVMLSAKARHVYAFEPNPESFHILHHLAKPRHNITISNQAVGAGEHKAFLNLVDSEASSLASSMHMLAGTQYRVRLRVTAVNLDSLGFDLTPSAMIIDCEGSEADVMRGATECLSNISKIFVETHSLADGRNTLGDVLVEVRKRFTRVGVVSTINDSSWVIGVR